MSDAASATSISSGPGQEGMTDRFGFIYEASLYDLLLLLRAKYCENTAPACLTGVKVADRKEDNSWSSDEAETTARPVHISKEPCDYDCTDTGDASSISTTSTRPAFPPGDISRPNSPMSNHGRPRASTITPSKKKLGTKSSSSVLSVDSDTPKHVCPETIKRILAELKGIHDQRQASQRKEWDVFVNQRSKASRSTDFLLCLVSLPLSCSQSRS